MRLFLLTVGCLLGCSGITTKLCGAPGQPCCAESTCDANASCGASDLCEACGAESQKCCAQDTCADTFSCVSGACVTALSCSVTCTLGTARCVNNGIETCTAAGVCPAWKTTIAACPSGALCTVTGTAADCVETCPGACMPDALLCTTDGLRRCVASGACPTLASETDNTDVPACISGGAITAELSWESPTPLGADLVDIAGDLSFSYWVLDDLGNIVRYALGPWEFEVRPTVGKKMKHIASCGQGSILFAAGEAGTVMRRSGGLWTEENVGSNVVLTDITCDSTRAYASSADGRLFVRNGSTWTGYPTGTSQPFNTLTTLFSAQKIYLGGESGLIISCDVNALPPTCTTESSGTTSDINSLWGDPFTNTVYAGGDQGTLLARGANWLPLGVTGLTPTDRIVSVTGLYDNSLDQTTVVAITEGGKSIIRRSAAVQDVVQLPEGGFTCAWAPNEDTLLYASRHGGLWFRPGLLSNIPFTARGGRKPISADLYAVVSVGQGRLFAVGEGGARYRRQNNTWSIDALGVATTATLRAMAVRSAGEIYAVGNEGTVLVRRFGTWVAEAEGLTTEALVAVVLDSERVWALGETRLLEKNLISGVWRSIALPTATPYPTSLALRKDVNGKATELVVAGEDCTVLSFSLTDDSFSPGPACGMRFDFNAAAFASSGDLILGAETGTIHRRTGATYTLEALPGMSLDAFYALVPDGSSMFAMGQQGRLLRRVGTSWMDVAPSVTNSELAAGVADEEGLFVVGTAGLVLRRQ